jgi:hypothetical protein
MGVNCERIVQRDAVSVLYYGHLNICLNPSSSLL